MQQLSIHKVKALETAEFGRDISYSLDDAILKIGPKDFRELALLSTRIKLCNSKENNWLGEDLHTDDGECYNANGRFWSCGSKLCPFCVAKQSRRARKVLRKVIADQKLLVGENLHFLTLTMPNKGVKLLEARGLVNYAWTMFRKKKWFTDKILGGFKSEEFTLTKNGYHYHIHLIVRSKYIDYKLFRRFWTECLHSAVKETQITFDFKTSDQLAMANCQRIFSVDKAILEVAKYVTKSDSWSKIPASDLLDICRIRRFPRMYEFFGCFRAKSIDQPAADDDLDTDETILDKKDLSDGEKRRSWRDEVQIVGAEKYFELLTIQFENCIEIRKHKLKKRYPFARFWQLSSDGVRLKISFIEKLRDFHMAYQDSPEGRAETIERMRAYKKAA